ncbi:uncharacterized protein LOC141581148, partial [Saimiri boliviensis]|uniref:uncharacterized protein LOC141581148 n=1 Tax=Saimiri boliviensis TaxID=27679 RepID=UPI003D782331
IGSLRRGLHTDDGPPPAGASPGSPGSRRAARAAAPRAPALPSLSFSSAILLRGRPPGRCPTTASAAGSRPAQRPAASPAGRRGRPSRGGGRPWGGAGAPGARPIPASRLPATALAPPGPGRPVPRPPSRGCDAARSVLVAHCGAGKAAGAPGEGGAEAGLPRGRRPARACRGSPRAAEARRQTRAGRGDTGAVRAALLEERNRRRKTGASSAASRLRLLIRNEVLPATNTCPRCAQCSLP